MKQTVKLEVTFDKPLNPDLEARHIARSVQDHLRQTGHPDLINADVNPIEGGICSGCGETGLFIHCGYCQGDD